MKIFRRGLALLLTAVLLFGCIPAVFGETHSHTFENNVCTGCGEVFGLRSAFLRLNEDINVVFTANIPAGVTSPRMTFTLCGITREVSEYTVNSDGKTCFTFSGVTPAHMADTITATLYADCAGQTLTHTVSYSVRTYCARMLEKYPDNTVLVTLLSDLLTYGDASQVYIGYNTDAPASAGLDLTPSTFLGISDRSISFTGTVSDAADWVSAALVLSNELAVRFSFCTPSVSGLTVRVTVGGRTQDFTAADFEAAGEDRYSFTFRGIKATEFDDTVSASFRKNGTTVGRTVSYSVNTYLCAMQNDTAVPHLQTLVRALYNYGVSAKTYETGAADLDQVSCAHAKCPVCGGCLEAACDCTLDGCCTPCTCLPPTESRVISEIESMEAWIGNPGYEPTVQTQNAPVGNVWLLSGSENWPVFASGFTPFSIARYRDGWLHLWLYVEDASKLVDGQIELTSAKGPDAQELSWNLTSLGLQSGWNELSLPFDEANAVGGAINDTAVNYIRIYAGFTTPCRIGIDKIEAVHIKPEHTGLPEDLLEGWALNDGGTDAAVASELPDGTSAAQRWGVWLPTDTFGLTLDFSTEGAYAKAQNTGAALEGDFAVSAWVLAPVREAGDRVLVQQGSAAAPEYTLYISGTDSTLCFTAADLRNTQSSGVSIVDGKWHHVLVSIAGNILTYYIDGAAVKTCTVSGTMNAANTDVMLGADASSAHGLDGSLAQVRIFGAAVTPEEATEYVLAASDNEAQAPHLDLKRGIVIDRRQYASPVPDLNEGQTVREDDIINCIHMGFDHVKLLLTPNHLIASDGSLIEENMAYITQVLGYVEKHDFSCILCIHPEGDFKTRYLGNLDNFELLCRWYGEFAAYIGAHWDADTVALQLMTEPAENNTTVSWSWMSDRMWGAVRNVLPEHTLLTSSDRYGNLERIKLMSPATDDNLVYTFTTYEPYTIGWYYYNTNYGQMNGWSYVHDIPYPVEEGVDYTAAIEYAIDQVPAAWKNEIRTQLWAYVRGQYDGLRSDMPNIYDSLYNANWHMLRAKSLDDWRQRYGGNIHIMCVEFGCMDADTPAILWHSAADCYGISEQTRLTFIRDMRSAFDAYDIGWDYWSYNEAHTVFEPQNHTYGVSPSPKNAVYMFDYDMLETGLGVTPQVSGEGQRLLMLDEVQRSIDWVGSTLNYETTGGYAQGADWLRSSISVADNLVFFRTFPETDASGFAGGQLHLWVYINNINRLSGGMVELTSAGVPDEEELWWPLRDYVTKSGWNEILLPLSAAQHQGSTAADLSKLDCIRIVMPLTQGASGGIDDIYLVTQNYRTDISGCDSAASFWGTGITVSADNAPYGTGFIRTGTAACPVLCKSFTPVLDLSGARNGKLHLCLWVEDASKVTNGQIELTSSGLSDRDELAFDLNAAMLHDGWNELTFNIADGICTGTPDLSALTYLRIYVGFTAPAAFAVDEIYADNARDGSPFDTAVATALETAVVNEGSAEMNAAIAAVLTKIRNGENVTVATLGYSFAAGAGATAGNFWVDELAEWLEGLDGNPTNGNVTMINAGIGSTEVIYEVARLQRDVLAYAPQLVFVETGVNDVGWPYPAEGYEGVVTKLLSAGIPVMHNTICARYDADMTSTFLPVNQRYGIPAFSLCDGFRELTAHDEIVGLRGCDFFSFDDVHPTNIGHEMIARLFTNYLQTRIIDKHISGAALSGSLPAPVTANGYADAVLFENFTQNENISVTCDGWTPDYSARVYQLSTEGWQTNRVGAELTFRINAGYFFMFFELTQRSGDLAIYVDGVLNQTITWAYLGTGYMNPCHILHLGNPGEHTVTLKLLDNANVANDWFGICAVGAANFSGSTDSAFVISEIEGMEQWIGNSAPTVVTGNAPVGNAYLKSVTEAWPVFASAFTPFDISDYRDGCLHMWLYISDASALVGGEIELNSNAIDTNEINWTLKSLDLHDGWNELHLPFADANVVGGDMDYSAVRYIRIFAGFNGGGYIAIDRLEAVHERPDAPLTPAADVFTVSEIESVEAWIGNPGFAPTVQTQNAPVGSAWLLSGSENWPVFASTFTPFDISAYSTGYLHLWLYVEDVSGLAAGEIELSSASAPDNHETSWVLKELNLQTGWNELYLPFAGANQVAGGADLAAVNYIRIYCGFTAACRIGIDRIEAVAAKP